MAKPDKIEGLDCDLSAAKAIQLVLISRFSEMAGFRDAALAWEDPEGVHDMRVASRRLRSAMKDFLPFMRASPLKECETAIRDLANALGTVRDADVSIDALEKLTSSCPAEVVAGLEALIEERKQKRLQGRELLQKDLAKDHLECIKIDFEKAIEKALRNKPRNHGEPRYAHEHDFSEIGKKIVSLRIDELRKRGPSVFEPFRTKRLHKLRIAAKHLRYTLQLFSECLSDSAKGIVEPVTRIQKALGDLHDADVFIEELGLRLGDKTQVSTSTADARHEHRAEVWLLGEYVRRRSDYFGEALEEWESLRLQLAIGAQAD